MATKPERTTTNRTTPAVESARRGRPRKVTKIQVKDATPKTSPTKSGIERTVKRLHELTDQIALRPAPAVTVTKRPLGANRRPTAPTKTKREVSLEQQLKDEQLVSTLRGDKVRDLTKKIAKLEATNRYHSEMTDRIVSTGLGRYVHGRAFKKLAKSKSKLDGYF